MRRHGMRVEIMIMIPPMVGVPAFFICPSRPRLRTISPTCMSCRRSMMRLPITVAMKSDKIRAIPERKEI